MSETAAPLLSDRWLARARQLNPYYRERLGWSVPPGFPADVASADFAVRVAAFQKEHGTLTVDGIVGPKTAAALHASADHPDHGPVAPRAGHPGSTPFPPSAREGPRPDHAPRSAV